MNIERNDKLITNKIDLEVKRFELLEKSFSKIYEAEKKVKEQRMFALECMGKVDEENLYLNDIYKNYKQTMYDLEKARDVKIGKLEKTIIPAVKYYPNKVKEFKKPLKSIQDLEKTLGGHQEKIEKAKIKNDIDTINKHEREFQETKKNKVISGNKLETEIIEFEALRVNDNKSVLMHYVYSELAYHANALQSLTKLYQEISILEPKEKLGEFVHKYNLNSLKDLNLEEKFGYKEGETQRKLENYKHGNKEEAKCK
jgi:hypothetical protein